MSQTNNTGSTTRTSKFAKMVGSSRLSGDMIALAALQAYDSTAKNASVYNKIKDYAGGTAYLIEFTNDNGGPNYWSVLLRDGETQVFYDYEMLLREAVLYKRRLSGISLSNIVISTISVIIVGTFVVRGSHVDPSLNYALSSVLGFWFGKTIARPN